MNPIPNRFESPEPIYVQNPNRERIPNPNRIDEHDLITSIPLPPFIDKEHEDWLYRRGRYARSSTLFSDVILPPTPEPWIKMSYRVLCCGSWEGVVGWVMGIIVIVIIATVLAVKLTVCYYSTAPD
jgi:hypothetical protein